MKVILLFSLLINIMTAQTSQELFLKACDLYQKKDFSEALQLFEQIKPKNSVIWYNMGNCAYKKGDNLNAILFWQRAMINGTQSIIKDSCANSQVVFKKMNSNNVLITNTSKIITLSLQLLLLLLLIILIVICCLHEIRKKQHLMVGCLASITILSFLTFNSYKKSYDKKAFLMHDGIIFAGPHLQYHQLMTVPAASTVSVVDNKNGWIKVKHNKQVGWIPEETLVRI